MEGPGAAYRLRVGSGGWRTAGAVPDLHPVLDPLRGTLSRHEVQHGVSLLAKQSEMQIGKQGGLFSTYSIRMLPSQGAWNRPIDKDQDTKNDICKGAI